MNIPKITLTLTYDGKSLVPNYANGDAFNQPEAIRKSLAQALRHMAKQLWPEEDQKSH